ncbi:MAG: DNA polymerase IV [[Clostridium] leptum]
MERTILHCDCNGFYASVECVLHPELRSVPMAVCGDPESRRGIILAKNELAKGYGIKTAETIWQAKRKCPQLVLAPAHHDQYALFSKRINGIYQRYTDLVEPFSIDESWLDVTGSRELFGGGKKIADELRKAVREETGVTISVGVSFNKVFAKLGSDYKKPDATTVISGKLPGAALASAGGSDDLRGDSSKAALEKLRVRTIGDLARLDRELLEKMLGKQGAALSLYANGLDKSPVRSVYEEREVKSIGNSITFKRNLTGIEDIRLGVRAIADQVASRLRRHRVKCATVQVVIKDPDFRVISRQRPLKRPTHLSRDLYECALAIILDSWKITAPIRMLSITGANLVGDGEDTIQEQLSLFDPPGEREAEERQENLETALDEIRAKFGREAVSFGSVIHNDLGIRDHKKEL